MGDATTILTYAQNKQDMICNNALGTAIIKRFHPQLCMCTGMGMGAENQCSNYVSSFCWTLLGLEMIFLKKNEICVGRVWKMCLFPRLSTEAPCLQGGPHTSPTLAMANGKVQLFVFELQWVAFCLGKSL